MNERKSRRAHLPLRSLSTASKIVAGSVFALCLGGPGLAHASGFALALKSQAEPPADAAAPAPQTPTTGPAAEPTAAPTAAPAPTEAPAPTVPEPEAAPPEEPTPTEPAEGPAEDEYASSKDAGEAMSGEEQAKDDLPNETETVGNQKKKPKSLSHKKTGMIGVAGGFGYSLITAGDKFCGEFSSGGGDSDYRKAVCTGLTPAFLDITLGYGAADRIDVVLGVRVNLQKRDYDNSECGGAPTCLDGKGLFVDKLGIGFLPGIRIWGGDPNKIFKIGGAIDLFYMFEDFSGYRNRPTDPNENEDPTKQMQNAADEAGVGDHVMGLRGGPILQVDPHHNVGIFFIPAALPSFRPKPAGSKDLDSGWFEIGFDLSIGIQARFP